ncbi:MAG: HlyD family efflux transporter periplasmic adaptor subunit [Pirellulales bacterium]
MKTKTASILAAVAIGAVTLAAVAIAQQPKGVASRDDGYLLPTTALDVDVPRYRVALIHEAQVPGQEPGVLVELNVVEGQQVKAREVLGKIDDSQPGMARQIAWEEHQAAKEKAENEVDVLYARKATELAKVEYDKSVKANEKTRGAVADIEMRRQYLTWERGQLETKRAISEKKIAAFTAAAKQFEIQAATEAVNRRQITSPVDGVVAQVHLHKGEWVKPGDAVLHVVQLDRLKVEGEVETERYSPGQLINRPVTVEATLQGRKVQFEGRITFVRPLLDGRGKTYVVKAEVDNRKEDGHWLLFPGSYVDMTINGAQPRLTKAE